MPRPIPPGGVRDELVMVRLNKDEKAELKRKAPAGMKLSTWARLTLLAARPARNTHKAPAPGRRRG